MRGRLLHSGLSDSFVRAAIALAVALFPCMSMATDPEPAANVPCRIIENPDPIDRTLVSPGGKLILTMTDVRAAVEQKSSRSESSLSQPAWIKTTVRIWRTEDGEQIATLTHVPERQQLDPVVSTDWQTVVVLSDPRTAVLVSLETGEVLTKMNCAGPITAVLCGPAESAVVTAHVEKKKSWLGVTREAGGITIWPQTSRIKKWIARTDRKIDSLNFMFTQPEDLAKINQELAIAREALQEVKQNPIADDRHGESDDKTMSSAELEIRLQKAKSRRAHAEKRGLALDEAVYWAALSLAERLLRQGRHSDAAEVLREASGRIDERWTAMVKRAESPSDYPLRVLAFTKYDSGFLSSPRFGAIHLLDFPSGEHHTKCDANTTGELFLNPDSPYFVTVGNRSLLSYTIDDDHVRIWDKKTGAKVRSISHPGLSKADFREGSTSLLTAKLDNQLFDSGFSKRSTSNVDADIIIWSPITGERLATFNQTDAREASLIAGGQRVFIETRFDPERGSDCQLWDVKTQKQISSSLSSSARFSPDGRYYFQGNQVFLAESGKEVLNLAELAESLNKAAYENFRNAGLAEALSKAVRKNSDNAGLAEALSKAAPENVDSAGLAEALSKVARENLDEAGLAEAFSKVAREYSDKKTGRSDVATAFNLFHYTTLYTTSLQFRGIDSPVFSPDSQRLAATVRQSLSLWDIPSRRQLLYSRFDEQLPASLKLTFSENGEFLIGKTEKHYWGENESADRKVWVWSVADFINHVNHRDVEPSTKNESDSPAKLRSSDSSPAAQSRSHRPISKEMIDRIEALQFDDPGFAERIAASRNTLQNSRKTHGDDHPETTKALMSVAVVTYQGGRVNDAVPILEDVVERRISSLGLDNSDTLSSLHWLAAGYATIGQASRSIDIFQQMLAIQRRKFGNRHTETVETMESLGIQYANLKDWQKCEAILRECLSIRDDVEPDHWTTFFTKSQLGHCLQNQNKFLEAEKLLLAGYEGMRSRNGTIPDTDKSKLDTVLIWISALYDAWGKKATASEWRRKIIKPKTFAPGNVPEPKLNAIQAR